MSSGAGLTLELVRDAHAARLRIAAAAPLAGDDRLMHRMLQASVNLVARNVESKVGRCNCDDVLQEFSIRVYRGLPGVKQGLGDLDKFKGWLRTIAKRACSDFTVETWRKYEVPFSGDPIPLDQHQGYASLPMDSAELVDLRNYLVAALARLDPKARDVIVRRDVMDLSIATTSEELGVKPNTVQTRLHRGRREASRMPDLRGYAAEYGLRRREGSG